MVRAFIAVDISREARDTLAQAVNSLKERGVPGVRWVNPEGIHLTLKFLGEIDPGLLDKISSGLERAAQGTRPFKLCLSGIGAFPNAASPRVIWVGIKGELDLLRELQGRVDQEMHTGGGFGKERRSFTPHLTLGRLRDNVSGEERRRAGKALAEVALGSEVSWQVTEVKLMRSTLTPPGAVYDLLGAWPL